jgi:hypothetical protein
LYVNVGATVASSSGEFVKDDVVTKEPVGNAKKFIQGTNIDRWHIDWDGDWLDYRPDEMSGPRQKEMYEAEKILVRKRTDRGGWIAAVYDDEKTYCDDTVLVCCDYEALKGTGANLEFEGFDRLDEDLDLYYVLALVNSTLMTWLFKNKFETGGLQGSYSDVWPQSVRSFPIPDTGERKYPLNQWENLAHEALPEQLSKKDRSVETSQELLKLLSEALTDVVDEKRQLNLNILDYLGIPTDGLPDSMAGDTLEGIHMPVSGVADTALNKTSEDLDGLRAEDVSFKDDGTRLVMAVDISYKPDEEDQRETDSYGRLAESEFETYDAMAFVELSDKKETLIRNFVPVAVQEAGGFADFRQNATKTKSPLDRLKQLTLPDTEEVHPRLEQCVEVSSRAEELTEKSEKTGALIDEIMYTLFGLSDEEIDTVESSLEDTQASR